MEKISASNNGMKSDRKPPPESKLGKEHVLRFKATGDEREEVDTKILIVSTYSLISFLLFFVIIFLLSFIIMM